MAARFVAVNGEYVNTLSEQPETKTPYDLQIFSEVFFLFVLNTPQSFVVKEG